MVEDQTIDSSMEHLAFTSIAIPNPEDLKSRESRESRVSLKSDEGYRKSSEIVTT